MRLLHSFPTRRSSDLALHAVHVELIRRHRESGPAPELLAEIDDFIQRGSATGVLLDTDADRETAQGDRKSTRLNSSHVEISYAGFCLKIKIILFKQSR